LKLPQKQWTGEDVRSLLERFNLNQHDFQRLTNIQQARVSDWIRGKTKISIVSSFALDRIEELLKKQHKR
jgi:DNA-binding transcriptional regulator YiaG